MAERNWDQSLIVVKFMKVCNNPDGCSCPNQKFCKWYGSEKKAKKQCGLKRTRIAPRSEKAKDYYKIYNALKETYLPGKRCAVFPEKWAGQIHHVRGRATNQFADDWARERDVPLLIDVRWFLPVSQEGHDWVHSHPIESRERGWLL